MRPLPMASTVVLAFLLGASGWAEGSAPDQADAVDPADPTDQAVWLIVETPAAGERQEGGLDWVRVAGRAGAGERVDYDVALVIDVSGSTAYASGSDVDGDGRLGKARRRQDHWRRFNPAHLSSDPGDTILAAELLASRRLVESLSEGATRVAVVTFADRARLESPLSNDSEATLAVLSQLAEHFGSGLTNLADALEVATEALTAAPETPSPRKQVIVVLSDGVPSAPGTEQTAATEALAQADAASRARIEIVSFGLGLEPPEEGDVYTEIAARTGGQYVHLEHAGDVVHALPSVSIASVPRVEIENLSLAAPGRATRTSADGSYDGFVPLAPGVNLLQVRARGASGAARQVDRMVEYVPRVPRSEAEKRELEARDEAFQRELLARTVAVDLAAEVAARRAAGQSKDLRLEAAEEVETAAD